MDITKPLTENMMRRYEIACNLKQPVVDRKVEEFVQLHYRQLKLEPKPFMKCLSFKDAWDARDAWAARDTQNTQTARDARVAWDAWDVRDVWDVWVVRDAWDARDARDAQIAWDAWAARITQNVWDARDARDAWDARDARDAWDASWIAPTSIGANEANKDETYNIFLPIFEAFESGLWLYWFYDDCFVWVPIPKVKTVNRRLHCENGPAFELPEEKLYFLNGVLVPEEIVTTPAQKLDPHMLLKETNAEVRREIVRKIGIESVCYKLGAKVSDKSADGVYELLMLDLGDGRERPYLKMRNPSIGVYHLEGVPTGIVTVEQALNWRNGVSEKPLILT